MPLKRRGPLQLVQREVDELEKQVCKPAFPLCLTLKPRYRTPCASLNVHKRLKMRHVNTAPRERQMFAVHEVNAESSRTPWEKDLMGLFSEGLLKMKRGH